MTIADLTEDTAIHAGGLLTSSTALACPRCGDERTELALVGLQLRADGQGAADETVGIDMDGRTSEPPEGMARSERQSSVALGGACSRGCEFTISFVQRLAARREGGAAALTRCALGQ